MKQQKISSRVHSLMIASGMFSGTMNPMPTYDEFAERLIRDCINTACLAELEGKNISKTMMNLYFNEVDQKHQIG